MIIIIRQSDERIERMHLRLMHATNGPLTGPLQTTTNTLTARNREGSMAPTIRKCNLASIRPIRRQRTKTRHDYKRQPPRIGA